MILAASGGYDIDNNHLYIVLQQNKNRENSRGLILFYAIGIIALRRSCLRPEATKLTRCGHTLDARRDLKAGLPVGI